MEEMLYQGNVARKVIEGDRDKKRPRGQKRARRKPFCFMDQVRYIQKRARENEPVIGRFGELALFSTESGDAWMLDTEDQTANRLAHDGVPRTVYIDETDTNFSVHWQGHYRLDPPVFVYPDNTTGKVVSILGYPDEVFEVLA
jgi:hypothetical protein